MCALARADCSAALPHCADAGAGAAEAGVLQRSTEPEGGCRSAQSRKDSSLRGVEHAEAGLPLSDSCTSHAAGSASGVSTALVTHFRCQGWPDDADLPLFWGDTLPLCSGVPAGCEALNAASLRGG